MKKFHVLVFCILMIIILLFIGCKQREVDSKSKKGGTVVSVMPWGQLTFNLNPFMGFSNRLAIVSAIYECLIYIPYTGIEYPLLATSYKWTNNNHNLIISLRKGVKWNNGHSFTSKDVAFTFNYIKKHRALDLSGVWESTKKLKSVKTNGKYEVIFKFSDINTPHLSILTQVMIVPEHIWSRIDDPLKFINEDPVGTGPFLFEKFSRENNIIYAVKNPNYWDKSKPHINSIEIHSVKDNNLCLLSLLKGEADWSYTFIPNVKEVWANKDPDNNKYWEPAVNTVIWFLNNEKPPLDNPKFRKALAMAINKKLMSENVYHGVGAAHATGIPKSIQNKWLTKELNDKAYTFNLKKAKKLLKEIGYTKKGDKLIGPDKKPVKNLKILVGAGWTDYISLAQIIIDNLKKLGITATINQQQWNTYFPSLQIGAYDTGISAGQGIGPSPYFMYVKHFSEIKHIGNTNFSRYIKDEIFKQLDIYQKNTDPEILKKSMTIISELILEDVPYIPLTNATSHNIFSEKKFAGWPSDINPYADGAPDTQGGAIILSNIHLK